MDIVSFCAGLLCDVMVLFVMSCYVMGPLVMAPYVGALPLVRWTLRAGTKDFCPALAAQVQNIFFLTVHYTA
jgi:hypothetical protein